MNTPDENQQPSAGQPVASDSGTRPARVVHYTNPRPRSRRNGTSLITRIVAAAAWLLVLVLIATLLKQLHAHRTAVPPPAPEPQATAAEPEALPEATPELLEEPQEAAIEPPPEIMVAAPPAPPAPKEEASQQTAQVTLTPAQNGNFYAPGEINGQPVLFVVDTGASFVSIPDKLRWNLKLTRGRYMQTATANGMAGMYETNLAKLSLGPIKLKNVPAVLMGTPMPNDVVLLGMSALREVRLLQQDGKLVLQQDIVADTATGEATEPAPAKPAALKKSVKECMGEDKVVNARVLKCMRGEDEAEASEEAPE